MNQPTTPPVQSNAPTFADLLKVADDLGQQAGKGKDTQVKFLLKVHEGAFLGVIDNDADKHGASVDDATKLTEAYVRAQSGATIFDAKAANQRVAISKTRTLVKLGMWPKGGVGEPLSTVNALMVERQKLRKDPANAKKLDDAANALIKFARVQVKRDHLIQPSEFSTFLFKASPDAQTEEEWWESVRKKAQRAKAGKGGVTIIDPLVDDIVRTCTKRLVAIAKAKAPQGNA